MLINKHLTFKSQQMAFYDWLCDSPRLVHWGGSRQQLRSHLCDAVSHLCWELRCPTFFGTGRPQMDTSHPSNLWQWIPESRTMILWKLKGLCSWRNYPEIIYFIRARNISYKVSPMLPLIQHSATPWELLFKHQLQRWRTSSKSTFPFLIDQRLYHLLSCP